MSIRDPEAARPRTAGAVTRTVRLGLPRLAAALVVTLSLLAGLLVAATVATPGPDADGRVADQGPVPLGLLVGALVAAGLTVGLRTLVRRPADRPFRPLPRRLGIAGVALGVLVLTGLFWWWQPHPTPAMALNGHLTAGLGAGAVGLLGCLVALALTRTRPARTEAPAVTAGAVELADSVHWTAGRWGRALAVLVALALTVGVGWLVDRAGQAALTAINEYRETPAPAAGPVTAPVSALTGGIRWQRDARLLDLPTEPSLSRYGLVLASGEDVVSVDPDSGAVQWRYFRSDVDATPRPLVIDGGNRVLVDWSAGHDGFVVLDARDGHRVARFAEAFDDDHLETTGAGADAVLLGREVGVGSDSIARVDDDGSTRWRYAPGRCRSLTATATPSAAVVEVQTQCGDPDQLVGLDPDTGRQRWTLNGSIDVLAATGDELITARAPGYDTLTAVDAVTGRTRWTRLLRSSAGPLDCTDSRRVAAVASVVQIACNLGGSHGARARLLRLDPGTGVVTADVPVGPGLLDVALTADGRGLVLTGSRDAATLTVVRAGRTTAVSLGAPVSDSLGRLAVAGDLVLIGTGTRVLALD